MTLSLVIIVKHGEKGMAKVIENVGGMADQVVIIKDKEKGGCKNFSELRNKGITKCTSDWILMIDTDEKLSLEAIQSIPALLQNNTIDGYWFRRLWYFDTTHYLRHGLFYPDWQLRLFRNKPQYRYIHRVHEELIFPKEKTKQIEANIYHYHSPDRHNHMYTHLAALDFKDLKKTKIWYLWKSVYTFIDMFFVALIRGKGILDGRMGIRAHYLFAYQIAKAYWEAAWS